jgi:dolichyl-phosphate beta-glucosyltransferase
MGVLQPRWLASFGLQDWSMVITHQPSLDISVVIPCYNEGENLERGALDSVYQYLQKQTYSWEVVVVNDESTDHSRQLLQEYIQGKANIRLVDIAHGGKPMAVWSGIKEALGDIVLVTDMDQSTPIYELEKLLPWYRQGYDVVIGSRGGGREGFGAVRKTGSFVFRKIRRLFILRDIIDTQCGFKSFKRAIALDAFPKLQFLKQSTKPVGWKVTAYDVELLFIFELSNCKIKEVFVEWENRDRSTTKHQTHLNRYLRESWEMALEIIRVRKNSFLNLYK